MLPCCCRTDKGSTGDVQLSHATVGCGLFFFFRAALRSFSTVCVFWIVVARADLWQRSVFLLNQHAVIYRLSKQSRVRTVASGVLWENTKSHLVLCSTVSQFLHKSDQLSSRFEGCLHSEPPREPYSSFLNAISEPEVRRRTKLDLHFLLILLQLPASVLSYDDKM